MFFSVFFETRSENLCTGVTNFPQYHTRHLLDDSVLEDNGLAIAGVTNSTDALSNESSESVIGNAIDNEDLQNIIRIQGCIRRKTLLKAGKKPAVASWQRFWLQMWSNTLVYFSPKSFKG